MATATELIARECRWFDSIFRCTYKEKIIVEQQPAANMVSPKLLTSLQWRFLVTLGMCWAFYSLPDRTIIYWNFSKLGCSVWHVGIHENLSFCYVDRFSVSLAWTLCFNQLLAPLLPRCPSAVVHPLVSTMLLHPYVLFFLVLLRYLIHPYSVNQIRCPRHRCCWKRWSRCRNHIPRSGPKC